MFAGLVSASVWFNLFFFGHITLFRFSSSRLRSKLILRLFGMAIIGHVVTILVLDSIATHGLAGFSSNMPLSILSGILTLLCLFVLYMPFYYTLNTSLSVETLSLLGSSPRGWMPRSEIEKYFTDAVFIRDRLETMEANGCFERIGGDSWILTSRGSRIAKAMKRVKQVFNLGPGG